MTISGRDTGACIFQYGTNADRLGLAAAGIQPLTLFHETDTGLEFKWYGSWVQQVAAGAGAGSSAATMPVGTFASGTLGSTTPVVIPMAGAPLPSTVTLKSAAGGRLIEISTDGGTEYFTPTTDITTTTMMVLTISTTVTHVRVTGAATNTYTIR